MLIDTRKKVIATQLRRMITMLIFALSIIIVLLTGKMPHTFLGLNKYNWALVIAAIYLVVPIFEGILELYYIYFSDDKNVLTFRYFSLGYFNRKKNMIEIPVHEFSKFEIRKMIFGLKQKLILYRRIKDKDAKYPPISISLLNKKERESLITALSHYQSKS
jgi:hypothetical protein